MAFEFINLSDTEFYNYPLSDLGIYNDRIPPVDGRYPWKCAYDRERNIIFTQLVSSTYEMRDLIFYHLLLLDGVPIKILCDIPDAKVIANKYSKQFKIDYIESIIKEVMLVWQNPYKIKKLHKEFYDPNKIGIFGLPKK